MTQPTATQSQHQALSTTQRIAKCVRMVTVMITIMITNMITNIVTMIMGMLWQKVMTTPSMAMSTVLGMTMITSMSMAMDTATVTRDRRRQLLRGLA